MGIQIPCKDSTFFFDLFVVKSLQDCDAKVSPEYQIDPATGNLLPGKIGNIYFKQDSFRSGVITHESVHMALAYLRIVESLPVLGDECDDNEEIIADHIGWFAARLGELFWELKESGQI